MRFPFTSSAIVLSVFVLAQPSFSQDELVLKKNHHVMHGKVVSSTADSVTFDHMVDGNSVEVHTFPLSEIQPISFYVIRRHAVQGDAAGCMELGQYCLDNGFEARARHLFETAARIDPSMKEQAEEPAKRAREASAAQILEEATAYQSEGKPYKAWHALQECIRNFDDTAAAAQAKDLVKPYFDAYQDRYMIKDFDANKASDKALEKVQRTLKMAAEFNSKALNEKGMGASLREFEKSAEKYEHALKQLENLAKRSGIDETQLDKIKALEEEAKGDCVHAHLNKAGIYMTRKAFQDAIRETQRAMAIDPENAEAKTYRSRVATVSGLSGW